MTTRKKARPARSVSRDLERRVKFLFSRRSSLGKRRLRRVSMRWLRSRPATPELCDPPAATGALDGACDPSAEAAGAMPAAVAGQKLAEEEEERHRLALAHLGTLQRRKTTASSRDPRLASRLSPLHTRLRRVASDLSPLSESEQRFLSEETLLRYLRARDGDEQRSPIASGSTLPRHVHHTSTGNEQLAFSMLEATLAWRRRHIAPACGEGGGLPRCEACEARVAEMPRRDVPAGWPSGCI